MLSYEPVPGDLIGEAAAEMIQVAKSSNDIVKAKFNDIELTATPDSTVLQITFFYREESERQAKAYRNSPEGKRAAQEREEHRLRLQQQYDASMRELPSLNFENDVAVLDWLCQIQEASDHIGIVIHPDVILAAFAAHGYRPNLNVGKDFNESDRRNVATYIIGQALDGLRGHPGAIRGVIHNFVERWKKQFLSV